MKYIRRWNLDNPTYGMFAQTVNLILLISFLNIVLVVGLSWNGQMERRMNN